MASSKETYCLCGQPYNIGQFMIECDCCREWFHGSCVDVKIYQSDDIDKYHCPKCALTYGPSVLKIPTNNHRADRYELGAASRPAQAGSPAWVRALAARPARAHPQALLRMRGEQFTLEFVRDNGFTRPIFFSSPEGLGMKIPNSATFTPRSVLRYCGAQMEVEVIDVRKQSTLRMPLGEFIEYMETPPESRAERVLNVISLEFSDTSMASLVEPPLTARQLDWAECVWPAAEARPPRPAVQRYCLVSAAGAYTDWHVDFGGTAVWYHLLHGKKTFYMAPPTATNLALYQQWSASNNQNERFFGDMVEWYGTAELHAGETLMIPSGWIHAVMTSRDALVLGGNLLHAYALEMQLQIYEIERRVETPVMFRYPLFESMHWYAGAHLLTILRRHNEESQDEDYMASEAGLTTPAPALPPLLLRGIKILANALKEWHALKPTDASKRDNVPKCLNSGQLVRELCKELRTLEKRTASAANKDKDFKLKMSSPAKSARRPPQKKSLKLTLPKPIMHMAHNNGDYIDEKQYELSKHYEPSKHYEQSKHYEPSKHYEQTKEILYQDARYITQDLKYQENGLQEAKTFVIDGKEILIPDKNYMYPNYDEQMVYGDDANGYIEDKKNGGSVLRIKYNTSPGGTHEAVHAPNASTALAGSARAPPPYTLPPHSLLKQHLTSRPAPHAASQQQQWTISKKELGEYQEEQILFTNENVSHAQQPGAAPAHAHDTQYGAGMYSAADIQQEYPYQSAKYAAVQPPEYGYREPHYTDMQLEQQATAVYTSVPVQDLSGVYQHHEPLPSYDAAIAHQYATTTSYVIEEEKRPPPPAPPAPVRRSERPARRRVSPTYDYEDGDLYIDETPAPRRRKAAPKNKNYRHSVAAGSSAVERAAQPARAAPANGIESLIQASVLAEVEPPSPEHNGEDAAVAGMLSISERYSAPRARTFGLARGDEPAGAADSGPSSGKRARRPPAPVSADEEEEDEEDIIREVHRDEEYVYPSLEMSSDEDEEWTSSRHRGRSRIDSRARSEKDAAWSPRARLGRLVPRLRSGRAARRECVRAALHHARSANAAPAHADRECREKNAKRAVIAAKSRRPLPLPPQPTPNKSNSRLKKGMKTAKQRLGKILKIHKMIY